MYCHMVTCCATLETIKRTIRSVANASQGVRLSGGHISPWIHRPWRFPHGLQRGSAVGSLSCPFSSFPCGAEGWVESGEGAAEKVAEPSPPTDPPRWEWTRLTLSVGLSLLILAFNPCFKSLSSSGFLTQMTQNKQIPLQYYSSDFLSLPGSFLFGETKGFGSSLDSLNKHSWLDKHVSSSNHTVPDIKALFFF